MNDTKRTVRCKLTNRLGNPRPNPALVPDAEILLCGNHMAKAMRLGDEIKAMAAERQAAARKALGR